MVAWWRKRTVRVAVPILAVTGVLWAVVSYGKYCIDRDAVWAGVSFDRGIALVYRCAPSSGIKRAFFFILPWKKVELEKVDSGA